MWARWGLQRWVTYEENEHISHRCEELGSSLLEKEGINTEKEKRSNGNNGYTKCVGPRSESCLGSVEKEYDL